MEEKIIKKEVVYVPEKKTKHKVKKEFTLDKVYFVGNEIELTEGKIKDSLINNKFI